MRPTTPAPHLRAGARLTRDQPVREHRGRQRLHVVGQDEVAVSVTARACAHRVRATVARGEAPNATSGASRVAATMSHHVLDDRVVHVHLADPALGAEHFLGSEHRLQLVHRMRLQLAANDVPGRRALGVADLHRHREPVELALGQWIRPVMLHRVLGRDHDVRGRQSVGDPLDRHLPLFHGLEQR